MKKVFYIIGGVILIILVSFLIAYVANLWGIRNPEPVIKRNVLSYYQKLNESDKTLKVISVGEYSKQPQPVYLTKIGRDCMDSVKLNMAMAEEYKALSIKFSDNPIMRQEYEMSVKAHCYVASTYVELLLKPINTGEFLCYTVPVTYQITGPDGLPKIKTDTVSLDKRCSVMGVGDCIGIKNTEKNLMNLLSTLRPKL